MPRPFFTVDKAKEALGDIDDQVWVIQDEHNSGKPNKVKYTIKDIQSNYKYAYSNNNDDWMLPKHKYVNDGIEIVPEVKLKLKVVEKSKCSSMFRGGMDVRLGKVYPTGQIVTDEVFAYG
jgi:hypothetical protein